MLLTSIRRSFWVVLPAVVLVFPVVARAQIAATVEDFFTPGSQPNTLTDPLSPFQFDCGSCHSGYDDTISPGDLWATSAMAQAMRDPIFHAALTIANQDVANSGSSCLRCHSAMGWMEGRSSPSDGSALSGTDYEGVSCSVCHRMVDPVFDMENPAADVDILDDIDMEPGNEVLTTPHNGSYIMDPIDVRRGPFELVPGFGLHEFAVSPFHQESLLCATCHEVSNPVFERVGGPVPSLTDTYVLGTLDEANPSTSPYDQFPEQRTYSEWLNSDFADGPIEMNGRFGGNKTAVSTCQDCHMPDGSGIACGIAPVAVFRDDLPLHYFLGAHTWLFDAVMNLDASGELYGPGETSTLTPDAVDAAQARNTAFLQAASDMEISVADGAMRVRVINQTGHKLPTGYPEGRRMWLNVKFFDGTETLIDERGAYNGTTADLTTGDTKVYEAKLGLDEDIAMLTGEMEGPSFHLVLANTWEKDNRIPPRGFTNAAFEAVQAAPVDYAYADGQYWDDTDFTVPCNAVTAEVTLNYQTSSKEYIEFLRDENEDPSPNTGTILHNQWDVTGRSAPIAMDNLVFTLPDCNANGTVDLCDIDNDPGLDMNGNSLIDLCEVEKPLAENHFGAVCASDQDCVDAGYGAEGVCQPEGTCYVPKQRVVSIVANAGNAGKMTARRVSLDTGGGSTVVLGWISLDQLPASPGQPAPHLLTDTPVYADWSDLDGGSTHIVHLTDCRISPGQNYLIEAIPQGAPLIEQNFSDPLILNTATEWGDLLGAPNPQTTPDATGPDGFTNLADALGIILGIEGTPSAPLVWLEMEPQDPNNIVNLADTLEVILKIEGGSYPFAAPLDCP